MVPAGRMPFPTALNNILKALVELFAALRVLRHGASLKSDET